MSAYTIAQAKAEIKASVAVYLKKDKNGNYQMKEVNRLPFFLQGPPGVGKTEAARQIAEELGIGFVSLSITHHTRNTILGLPMIQSVSTQSEVRYTEYTMSEMIAMVEKKVEEGYSEGILLVDEFSSMADSLVAPMLAFLQTKNIGNHVLPEGWVIILCSNPTKYNKTARTFDMAVMDRVRYMEVTYDADEFVRYGEKIGVHRDILGYLKLYPGDVHVCETSEQGERVIVTTRGWENLSWCLKGYEETGENVSVELIRQFIKSEEISTRFYEHYLSAQCGLRAEEIGDILDGRNLSRYIDDMREKQYKERFRAMRLIGTVLASYGEEQGECANLCNRIEDVKARTLDKASWGNDITFAELVDEYLNDIRVEVDEAERTSWSKIMVAYRKKLKETLGKTAREPDPFGMGGLQDEIRLERRVEADRRRTLFEEAAEEYLRVKWSELNPMYGKISKMVTHACEFLEAIEEEDNLMDPFISMLNQSEGILDAMAAVKTPLYLKYSRRAYGADSFLKRAAGV